MVTITKGCLVKTESSIKEVVVSIAENEHFLIEDINDNMVFITEDGADGLKDRIDTILNGNKD